MIKIELLKNHPNTIAAVAHIWHEVLGKIWVPDVPTYHVITRFADHLKIHALSITFIALDGDLPVGMCSLRENDGIRPDLTPWLGSLIVDPIVIPIKIVLINSKKIARQHRHGEPRIGRGHPVYIFTII